MIGSGRQSEVETKQDILKILLELGKNTSLTPTEISNHISSLHTFITKINSVEDNQPLDKAIFKIADTLLKNVRPDEALGLTLFLIIDKFKPFEFALNQDQTSTPIKETISNAPKTPIALKTPLNKPILKTQAVQPKAARPKTTRVRAIQANVNQSNQIRFDQDLLESLNQPIDDTSDSTHVLFKQNIVDGLKKANRLISEKLALEQQTIQVLSPDQVKEDITKNIIAQFDKFITDKYLGEKGLLSSYMAGLKKEHLALAARVYNNKMFSDGKDFFLQRDFPNDYPLYCHLVKLLDKLNGLQADSRLTQDQRYAAVLSEIKSYLPSDYSLGVMKGKRLDENQLTTDFLQAIDNYLNQLNQQLTEKNTFILKNYAFIEPTLAISKHSTLSSYKPESNQPLFSQAEMDDRLRETIKTTIKTLDDTIEETFIKGIFKEYISSINIEDNYLKTHGIERNYIKKFYGDRKPFNEMKDWYLKLKFPSEYENYCKLVSLLEQMQKIKNSYDDNLENCANQICQLIDKFIVRGNVGEHTSKLENINTVLNKVLDESLAKKNINRSNIKITKSKEEQKEEQLAQLLHLKSSPISIKKKATPANKDNLGVMIAEKAEPVTKKFTSSANRDSLGDKTGELVDEAVNQALVIAEKAAKQANSVVKNLAALGWGLFLTPESPRKAQGTPPSSPKYVRPQS